MSCKVHCESIMAGLLPAVLVGGLLTFAGCGGADQTDGELVQPTDEVAKSRAAMQGQLKENPNMYRPRKGGGQKSSRP